MPEGCTLWYVYDMFNIEIDADGNSDNDVDNHSSCIDHEERCCREHHCLWDNDVDNVQSYLILLSSIRKATGYLSCKE